MLARRLSVAALLIALSSCVSPSAPPPPPPPVDRPPPPAPPPVVAASSDWRDWPLTPGDWSYAREGGGSIARFGAPGAAPLLTLRCDPARRQVSLSRTGASGGAVTVRTSSTARAIAMQPAAGGYASAALPGSDPILDAMGYSRGRFVVEQAGGPALVLPAWAEILRVAEDCRG